MNEANSNGANSWVLFGVVNPKGDVSGTKILPHAATSVVYDRRELRELVPLRHKRLA